MMINDGKGEVKFFSYSSEIRMVYLRVGNRVGACVIFFVGLAVGCRKGGVRSVRVTLK